MKEKNSLKEVIRRNHEKSNQEYREKLKRYIELQKKQQRRETIPLIRLKEKIWSMNYWKMFQII